MSGLAARQRDVHGADGRLAGVERGAPLGELLLDLLLELVGELAERGFRSGGAEATDFISAVTAPLFRPRYLSRSA